MKDKKYIERIITYSSKINRYMEHVNTFSEFIQNGEKVDAVMLNLEQLGETAKKLSVDTIQTYDLVDWPKIIGLRNIISHEYEGIRLEIIYQIAKDSIPKLLCNLMTHVE